MELQSLFVPEQPLRIEHGRFFSWFHRSYLLLHWQIRPREQVPKEVRHFTERDQLIRAMPANRKFDVCSDRDAVPCLHLRTARRSTVPGKLPQSQCEAIHGRELRR